MLSTLRIRNLPEACNTGDLELVNCILAKNPELSIVTTCLQNENIGKYTPAIIQSLNFYWLAKQASQRAGILFPKEDTNAVLFSEMQTRIKTAVESDGNAISKTFQQYKLPLATDQMKSKAHDTTLIALRHWTIGMLSIFHTLHVTHNNNFKHAYCDCIASAIFCSLLNTGIKLEKFDAGFATDGNHTFIIINRQANSTPNNPATWGDNAYFVNWHDEIYPVSNRPADSILNELVHATQLHIYSNKGIATKQLYMANKILLAEKTQNELRSKLINMAQENYGNDFLLTDSTRVFRSKFKQ